MRGTLLHPNPAVATVTGILFSGIVLFVAGLLLIQAFQTGNQGQTIYRDIPVVPSSASSAAGEGGVFLLDAEKGKIMRIGTFDLTENPSVSLRLPAQYHGRVSGEALIWNRRYANALPYIAFVGDEDVRAHWGELGREALSDPEMYQVLISVLGELPRVWRESGARLAPDELISALMRDPQVRLRFEEFMTVLEPRFSEAVYHLLWNQASNLEGNREGVPNVKLVWAARRLLLGAREPALTIFATPERSGSDMPEVIQIREVF